MTEVEPPTLFNPRTLPSATARSGFTLVELLVVIGIIAILASMLLPALQRARAQVLRVQCASNMHQWSVALAGYAASNKGEFPDNTDANDMSWIGQCMIGFSNDYMGQGLNGFHTDDAAHENHDHVMYCPTQEWHRWVRENYGWSVGGEELVGYFYLPCRAIAPDNPGNGADYTPAGMAWVLKKKFYNNDAPEAPILMDMIQDAGGAWGGPVPYSSHVEKSGNTSSGSNFLFEDGHVSWYDISTLQIGGHVGSWNTWYKIPIYP